MTAEQRPGLHRGGGVRQGGGQLALGAARHARGGGHRRGGDPVLHDGPAAGGERGSPGHGGAELQGPYRAVISPQLLRSVALSSWILRAALHVKIEY